MEEQRVREDLMVKDDVSSSCDISDTTLLERQASSQNEVSFDLLINQKNSFQAPKKVNSTKYAPSRVFHMERNILDMLIRAGSDRFEIVGENVPSETAYQHSSVRTFSLAKSLSDSEFTTSDNRSDLSNN